MEATLEERFAELDVKEKSTEECIREEKQRIRVSVWKTLEEQKNIRVSSVFWKNTKLQRFELCYR